MSDIASLPGNATRLFVVTQRQRPDVRLITSFLWGDAVDCDSDGNSPNPASGEWTEFYCRNREAPGEVFEITLAGGRPLTLEVTSSSETLAARVAHFLAVEANGQWARDCGGPYRPAEELIAMLGVDFDLEGAWRRADTSIWRSATLENPYPNLKNE